MCPALCRALLEVGGAGAAGTGLKAQGRGSTEKVLIGVGQVGEGVPEGANLSRALRTSWNVPVEKEAKEHSRKGSENSQSIGAPARSSRGACIGARAAKRQ